MMYLRWPSEYPHWPTNMGYQLCCYDPYRNPITTYLLSRPGYTMYKSYVGDVEGIQDSAAQIMAFTSFGSFFVRDNLYYEWKDVYHAMKCVEFLWVSSPLYDDLKKYLLDKESHSTSIAGGVTILSDSEGRVLLGKKPNGPHFTFYATKSLIDEVKDIELNSDKFVNVKNRHEEVVSIKSDVYTDIISKAQAAYDTLFYELVDKAKSE